MGFAFGSLTVYMFIFYLLDSILLEKNSIVWKVNEINTLIMLSTKEPRINTSQSVLYLRIG